MSLRRNAGVITLATLFGGGAAIATNSWMHTTTTSGPEATGMDLSVPGNDEPRICHPHIEEGKAPFLHCVYRGS